MLTWSRAEREWGYGWRSKTGQQQHKWLRLLRTAVVKNNFQKSRWLYSGAQRTRGYSTVAHRFCKYRIPIYWYFLSNMLKLDGENDVKTNISQTFYYTMFANFLRCTCSDVTVRRSADEVARSPSVTFYFEFLAVSFHITNDITRSLSITSNKQATTSL